MFRALRPAILFCFVVISAVTGAEELDHGKLLQDVKILASPAFEGRLIGSEGSRKAQQYLNSRMKECGLEPIDGDYKEKYKFSDATNLVGRIKGSKFEKSILILTAHYDHLGIKDGKIYPGADDNASGVAALLAVSKYLSAHPPLHTVLVVFFDGEEEEFQGSSAFFKKPPVPLSQLLLNINLDMVSHNDKNEIYASGTDHYPWVKPFIDRIQKKTDVHILFGHDKPNSGNDDWTDQSDHFEFFERGIPYVYFGVEDHPDYHQPTDTFENMNRDFFIRSAEMILQAILEFDRVLETSTPR